ncbi:hypothetical protein MMC10_005161 [Thelotrema lepadinum]|nr:hypothetical protein [Thelotrema lepadinum]
MPPPTILTTGHNPSGLSTFIPNPPYKQITPSAGVLYSTPSNHKGEPLDLNSNADLAAFAAADHSALIPKEGSVVLVVELAPGMDTRDQIHRTLSVDVCVVLNGEVECHLDSGESRVIGQGEVLLQRGTKHAWVNPSETETARMLCFVVPCKAVEGARE